MKALELIEKVNGKFYESRRATQPKGANYTCDWENAGKVDTAEELKKKVTAGTAKMKTLAEAVISAGDWKEEAVRRAGELSEVLKTFKFDAGNLALTAARMYQLETYANRLWFLESVDTRAKLPVKAQWIATEKKDAATKESNAPEKNAAPKKTSAPKKSAATKKSNTQKSAPATGTENQMEAALSAVLQGMSQMLQQNQRILDILAAQKK